MSLVRTATKTSVPLIRSIGGISVEVGVDVGLRVGVRDTVGIVVGVGVAVDVGGAMVAGSFAVIVFVVTTSVGEAFCCSVGVWMGIIVSS